MVAGHKIAITDPEKATVFLVKESGEKAEIQKNGDVYEVEVSALSTNNKKEEQILIQSEDNTYTIHTRPETMANLTTYVDKNKVEKGAYTFAVDHYLIRVNTEEKIIYYRNMDCTGEKTGELMWTLSGLNDEFVLSRSQKFIGQNFAYMTNGSGERLVFDNHTSFAQNETRMAEFQFRNRNETGVMQTTF